jgi:hypothetical protein
MNLKLTRPFWWALLLVGALILVVVGATPAIISAQSSSSGAWVDQALQATAKIWVVTEDANGDLEPLGTCSGTMIHPSGLVLTNWHCVGQTDIYGPDDTGLDLQHGEMYHPKGLTVLGFITDPTEEPVPTYVGQILQGSPDVDLAVIKIIATLDAGGKLPKRLPITPIELGDSSKVKLNDQVYVFGYPGSGGPLITSTTGQISGFYKAFEMDKKNKVDAFKTDAVIEPGNSGGLATNKDGMQIGVPAFHRKDSALGGIILVNIAKPFIDKALSDSFDPLPPRKTPGSGDNTNPQPNNPPKTGGPFGAIAFGVDIQNGKVTGQGQSFPEGAKQVVAAFDYSGMKSGTPWGYVLRLDGDPAINKPNTLKWDEDSSGSYSISFSNQDEPLPVGEYELSLLVNQEEAQRGQFQVVKGQSAPETPGASKGTIFKGQVVDADTRRPIAGALVVLLEPGSTVQDWIDRDFEPAMVVSVGETGRDGSFRTDPPLARDQTYSVIVGADGYDPLTEDDALTIPADAPAEIDLGSITLASK